MQVSNPTKSYPKADETHVVHYAKRDAQEHHIIPRQLSDHPLVRSSAYNIEGESNLMFLPTGRSGMGSNPEGHSLHLGSHPDYTVKLKDKLDKAYKKAKLGKYTQEERLEQVQEIVLEFQSKLTQKDEHGSAFRMNARQDRWDQAIQVSQKPTGEIIELLRISDWPNQSLFTSIKRSGKVPPTCEGFFPKENFKTLATNLIKDEQDNLMNELNGVRTISKSETKQNGGVTFTIPAVYKNFEKQSEYQLVMPTTLKMTSNELAKIIDELRVMVYLDDREPYYHQMAGRNFNIIAQTSMPDTEIGKVLEEADMLLKGYTAIGVFFPDNKVQAGLELLKNNEKRIRAMLDDDLDVLTTDQLYEWYLECGAIDVKTHPEHKDIIAEFNEALEKYEEKYCEDEDAGYGYCIIPKTKQHQQNGKLLMFESRLVIQHHFIDSAHHDSDSPIEPNPFKILTEKMGKNSPHFQNVLEKIKVIHSLYVLFCNLKAKGQIPICARPPHNYKKPVKTHRLLPHILCQKFIGTKIQRRIDMPHSHKFLRFPIIFGGVNFANKYDVLQPLPDEEKKKYEGQYGAQDNALSIKIEVAEISELGLEERSMNSGLTHLSLEDTKRRYEETKEEVRETEDILVFDSSRLCTKYPLKTIDQVRVKISTGITSYGREDSIKPDHFNMASKLINKQAVLIGLLERASATTINETTVGVVNVYPLILSLIFFEPFAMLDMVLKKPSIDVTKKYKDKTALYFLMNYWNNIDKHIPHERDKIAKLVEYGIDLNQLDGRGKSIMEHAIEKNDHDLFYKVYNNTTFNRDMKIDGMSLLQYALKHERITISRELFRLKRNSIYHKDKDGHDALYYAYRYQSPNPRTKDIMANEITEKIETDKKNEIKCAMEKQQEQQEKEEKEEERLALKIKERKLKNRVKEKVLKAFCMA